MANNILTHQVVAREAAKMLAEDMNFIGNINRGRDDEFTDRAGYRTGQTVTIGIPVNQRVYDGSTFGGGDNTAGQNQAERAVSLTLSTQKHVPLSFSSVEKALTLAEFRERFLVPAMNNLASFVQADLLNRAARATFNQVGTPGVMPNSRSALAAAKAVLDKSLAPTNDKSFLITSDTNLGVVTGTQTLFNPTAQISRNYMKGELGEVDEFSFYVNQSLPTVTYGSVTTGLTVQGAGQAGATLTLGGASAGATILAGSVFTLAGVYAVHPVTGAPGSSLRTFVVTADTTATGTSVTVPVSPAISATAPNATVSALPANGAGVVFQGAANTGYRQNLAFQKDAFCAAFAPLPILESCKGANARYRDFSVRVMTFGDGYRDVENTRIDVLYGFAAVRPEHAVRLTE